MYECQARGSNEGFVLLMLTLVEDCLFPPRQRLQVAISRGLEASRFEEVSSGPPGGLLHEKELIDVCKQCQPSIWDRTWAANAGTVSLSFHVQVKQLLLLHGNCPSHVGT